MSEEGLECNHIMVNTTIYYEIQPRSQVLSSKVGENPGNQVVVEYCYS